MNKVDQYPVGDTGNVMIKRMMNLHSETMNLPGTSDNGTGKDHPEAPVSPKQKNHHPIILYDEHCNLCSATVMFVLRNDPEGRFRFVGLRSDLRKKKFPLSVNDTGFKSVILVEDGKKYFRSEAVLRIFRKLRFPVNLLYGMVIIPGVVRDSFYNLIAKNRFRWFGKKTEPFDPPTRWKDRFLADGNGGNKLDDRSNN